MKEIEAALLLDLRPWRKSMFVIQYIIPFGLLLISCNSLRNTLNLTSEIKGAEEYIAMISILALALSAKNIDFNYWRGRYSEKLFEISLYIALIGTSILNFIFLSEVAKNYIFNLINTLGVSDFMSPIVIIFLSLLLGILYPIAITFKTMRKERYSVKNRYKNTLLFNGFRNLEHKSMAIIIPLEILTAGLIIGFFIYL